MAWAIKAYNTNIELLAYVENAYNISYELKLNKLSTCSFKVPKHDKKNRYLQPFNFIELFDNGRRVGLFRILPSIFTRDNVAYIEYYCEHVLATLLDDVLFKYHQIGNTGVYTKQVIRYVLDKQSTPRWQLGECDFNRQFEYKWENENLLVALFSIPTCFNEDYKWVADTTVLPWMISLKRLSSEVKSDITYRKNMQNIKKKSDPTNLVTRLYVLGYGEGDNQLDIKSVNNGSPYLEQNVSKYGLKSSILIDRRFENPITLKEYARTVLDGLSEPHVTYKVNAIDLNLKDAKKYPRYEVGDIVMIRDREDDINVKYPIVSIKKVDITGNPLKIDIEIKNKSQNITGSISDLMERARISDTYAQGATNLMQMCFSDNADKKHPALLRFYLPLEMARVNKLILKYSLDNFRAYSKAVKGGGATSETTSSGGGYYDSTSSGGGSWATTRAGGALYFTTHGSEDVYGDNVYRRVTTEKGYGSFVGYAEDYHVYRHSHRIELQEHDHDVWIAEHAHRINVPAHVHSFRLLDHTHDIEYGINQGSRANVATLKVDGADVNITDTEVDIIPYLSKDGGGKIKRGTWHIVEIVPDRLTRVNASLFIQLFTNSRGGGDY